MHKQPGGKILFQTYPPELQKIYCYEAKKAEYKIKWLRGAEENRFFLFTTKFNDYCLK
jgi:hypothetical protein